MNNNASLLSPKKMHSIVGFNTDVSAEIEPQSPRTTTTTSGPSTMASMTVQLCVCCFPLPLLTCVRLIGYISALPLLLNLALLLFANDTFNPVNILLELVLFALEILAILALFFGLGHRRPNYLKPFLAFGVIWNMLLLLLLLFCMIEMFVEGDLFAAQILVTAHQLMNYQPSKNSSLRIDSNDTQIAFWLTILMILALALIIVIDVWLLKIVLLAYLSLKRVEHQLYWTDDGWPVEMRTALILPEENFAHTPLQPRKNEAFLL